MGKRGLSNLLAVVLLVLVGILAVFVIYNGIITITNLSNEKSDEALICLREVNLEITGSCYSNADSILRFTVKNSDDFDYGADFFKIKINLNGNIIDVATQPMTLKGLEQKEFIAYISNPGEIEEAIFIPKIKKDEGYCYGRAISFKPVAC